jgi:hypothetical protein
MARSLSSRATAPFALSRGRRNLNHSQPDRRIAMPLAHTPDDLVSLRAEMHARREAMLQERIRALHASDRNLPPRQIASWTGVSTRYVENVLGVKSPPEGIILG